MSPATYLFFLSAALGLMACTAAEDLPAERPDAWPFEWGAQNHGEAHRELWAAWQALNPPQAPGFEALNEGWSYAPGAPDENLNTPLEARPAPGSSVTLPHRVLLPDRAMWYWRRLDAGVEGLLAFDADDGAQVWLDGEAISPRAGEGVQIAASDAERELTVRVLNNAMHGGLRGVHRYDPVAYAQFLERSNLYLRATLLTHEGLKRPDAGGQALLEFVRSGAEPGILGWPAELAPFLAGPLVQQPTPDSLIVLMELLPDHPEARLVLVDTSDAQLQAFAEEPVDGLVEFNLTGLPRGSTLRYYVESGGFTTPVYALRVPDPQASRFSFTAWADSQGGWPVFSRLVYSMAAHRAAFSVGVGDLTSRGWQPWQWSALMASLEPLSAGVPVYLIPGNHDYDGFYDDLVAAEYHRFARGGRYRAWTYGPARFVALDPNASFPIGIDEEQKAWLEAELGSSAWRNARWRFVLIHQPPYSQGWPGYAGDAFIRDWVEAHAESAGIDFVLSGHTHDYERLTRSFGSQTTTFFILGGAGGGLEPSRLDDQVAMDKVVKTHHYAHFTVSPDSVAIDVYALEGDLIDRYTRLSHGQ